ncbi:MAG TPA: thiamine phosphate synthase [Alphaproteobacteria bacterium]|nr:thiamine phosphate synthase [Alphaproteobacteria bacterium]HOO50478.1 thiamine phosphate synthase [Alphaproteobacteria bacterium]
MNDLFDSIDDPLEEEASSSQKSVASSPDCGLYLILSPTADHDKQAFQLGQALHAANRFSAYSLNRHVVEFRPEIVHGDDSLTEIAKKYCDVTQKNGFVFLIYDDIILARDIGADGVLCSSLKKCSDARKMLDENAIIGLKASAQTQAQSAISLELDYVLFSRTDGDSSLIELLNWWTTTTDIPAAIEGNFDQENCAPFILAGATFIDASHHIWTHPSGNPMQGTVNMLDAIERHGTKPQALN